MFWLFMLIVIVVILGAAVAAFTKLAGSSLGGTEQAAKPTFSGVTLKAKPVQNGTETRFYYNLLQAMPSGYLAFPQVNLGSLIEISTAASPSARTSAENRIHKKSVDFAIIRAADQTCELVIELDGPDHDKKARKKSDDVKEHALRAAGIKLLRLPAANYSSAEIAKFLTGSATTKR